MMLLGDPPQGLKDPGVQRSSRRRGSGRLAVFLVEPAVCFWLLFLTSEVRSAPRATHGAGNRRRRSAWEWGRKANKTNQTLYR